MTYQVTALYQDAEVGYGESDVYEDAAREAASSVPSIYPQEDVMLNCTSLVGGMPVTVSTPLDLWLEFCPA
jgi:hypothetical protein